MKCVDAVHLAYLQTFDSLFCQSKFIDSEGNSTLKPILEDECYVLNDDVQFMGDSTLFFRMVIKASNYDKFFDIRIEIPVIKKDFFDLLGFANELNLEGNSAAVSFDRNKNLYLIQSRTYLDVYGLVKENNDEPDNHHGFFYAVEAAKQQILITCKVAGKAAMELESLRWMPQNN